MNNINMVSSGNILKDYQMFVESITEKANIKNKEAFNKDLIEFISKVVKPEYYDSKEFAKLANEKKEELDEITKGFFELIDKHSEGFDFYEGALEEIEFLKKAREKMNGN